MDLLASLGLGTALPEQSTRLISHPGIIKALENSVKADNDNGVRLGFNHCLTCGIRFVENDDAGRVAMTTCKGCGRVKYCSRACQMVDSKPATAADIVVMTSSSRSSSSMLERRYDTNSDDDDDEDDGNGHSPVVCSLLRLCNDDEVAEDELLLLGIEKDARDHRTKKTTTMPSSSSSTSCGRDVDDERNFNNIAAGGSIRKEAAKYRIQTERESYPATLFNILSEGPDWFVESITRRLRCDADVRSPMPEEKGRRRRRRGKRERTSSSPKVAVGKRGRDQIISDEGDDVGAVGGSPTRKERELVLHIVGASTNSELWGWDMSSSSGKRKKDNVDDVPVLNAYAEASTNLSSYLKNLLEISSITMRCVFVGPDCPDAGKGGTTPSSSSSSSSPAAAASHAIVQVPIPDEDSSSTLTMETYRCKYGGHDQPYLPYPDVIVFFNPGFSCPDYDWTAALSAAMAYQYSSIATSGAIPFLITTNTEMEGFADIKYLLDGGYVDERSLPRDVLEMIDQTPATDGEGGRHADVKECDDDRVTSFFLENPYAGLRVRQSGTMANDLYVKNRWIIGGLFHTGDSGGVRGDRGRQEQQLSKKRKSGKFNPEYGDEREEDGRNREMKARKLHHRAKGQSGPKEFANEKGENPALI